MAMAYNNTSVPVGPAAITVTINSVAYIIDEIEITRPTNFRVRTDGDDAPSGQWASSGVETGTATLQLATSATALPPLYTEFTVDAGGGSSTYMVAEVSAPASKGESRVVRIAFRKKI